MIRLAPTRVPSTYKWVVEINFVQDGFLKVERKFETYDEALRFIIEWLDSHIKGGNWG